MFYDGKSNQQGYYGYAQCVLEKNGESEHDLIWNKKRNLNGNGVRACVRTRVLTVPFAGMTFSFFDTFSWYHRWSKQVSFSQCPWIWTKRSSAMIKCSKCSKKVDLEPIKQMFLLVQNPENSSWKVTAEWRLIPNLSFLIKWLINQMCHVKRTLKKIFQQSVELAMIKLLYRDTVTKQTKLETSWWQTCSIKSDIFLFGDFNFSC